MFSHCSKLPADKIVPKEGQISIFSSSYGLSSDLIQLSQSVVRKVATTAWAVSCALSTITWAIITYFIVREKQRARVELTRLKLEAKEAQAKSNKFNLCGSTSRLYGSCRCTPSGKPAQIGRNTWIRGGDHFDVAGTERLDDK